MKKRWKLKELLLSSTLALSLGVSLPQVVAEEGEELPQDQETVVQETETVDVEETATEETPAEEEAPLEAEVTEDVEQIEETEDVEQDEETGLDEETQALVDAVEEALEDEEEVAITIDQYKEADATEMARWIREGLVTPEQLMDYAYEIIEETDPELHNIISLRKELALKELHEMEYEDQPFYGVPILVKGLGHTVEGGINSQGLEFQKDNISTRTGNYVKTLQKAGFVVLGQTAYPQFGWINVTNSDLYGNTHNPWDLDHNPGGSSGGSSAAVAIGQVPIATTSDAGGSTRIPASWSGVIGLHPSRGVLENNSDSAHSQTSHFVNTKTMEDTKALFEFLLKDKKVDDVKDLKLSTDMRIAYTTKTPAGTPISDDAIQAIQEAVAFLESQGFKPVEVDYPVDGKRMMMNYYTIASGGASSINFMAQNILKRNLKPEDVELLTWALYQTGKVLEKSDIEKAWEDIALMTEELNEFHKNYDFLLTPTTSYTAPAADYNHIPEELKDLMLDMSALTKEERLNLIYDQWLPAWTLTPYTQLGNLTGTPALSLPTYVSPEGLPLGIQFSSIYGNDRLLLQMGDLFEQNNRLHTFYSSEEEEVEEVEEFETIVRFNKDLEYGKKNVIQAGENRVVKETYQVKYAGTKEVSRTLIAEEVLAEGADFIIEVGTKVVPPIVEDEDPETDEGDKEPETDNEDQEQEGDKDPVEDTKEDQKNPSEPAKDKETETEKEQEAAKESAPAQKVETKQGSALPETGETHMPALGLFGLLSLFGAGSLLRKKRKA